MYSEADEAKMSTTLATSSGWPTRPSGMRSPMAMSSCFVRRGAKSDVIAWRPWVPF
jgi:hypothetical protein